MVAQKQCLESNSNHPITSPAVQKMIPSAARASSARVGIWSSRAWIASSCAWMRARSVRGRVAGRMYRMLDMRGGYRNLVNNQLLEQIRRAFLRLLIELPITVLHGQTAGSLPGPHRDPFERMLIARPTFAGLVLVSNEAMFDLYAVRRLW